MNETQTFFNEIRNEKNTKIRNVIFSMTFSFFLIPCPPRLVRRAFPWRLVVEHQAIE